MHIPRGSCVDHMKPAGDWKMPDMANLEYITVLVPGTILVLICNGRCYAVWTLLQLADLGEPEAKKNVV